MGSKRGQWIAVEKETGKILFGKIYISKKVAEHNVKHRLAYSKPFEWEIVELTKEMMQSLLERTA